MKLSSIRARMTLILALATGGFMVALSLGYWTFVRYSLETGFAASLNRMAQTSESLAQKPDDLAAFQTQLALHNAQVTSGGAISENVDAWLVAQNDRLVRHFGPDGRALFPEPSPHLQRPNMAPPPPVRELAAPSLPSPVPPLERPADWRIHTVKWGAEDLILALPWHRAKRQLLSLLTALVALCVLVTAGAALGAYVLVGRTLSPIEALARQAQNSFDDPTRLLQAAPVLAIAALQPTSSDQEIRHLVTTLNGMLERVREAALSKERFHTSASHELRTPLQALAGHLSVALARERDTNEYKAVIEEAVRQTARLSKLTNDLLLLNRLQTASGLPYSETVDVTEMCDIALQRAQKVVVARDLHLCEQWESLEIEAPPSFVEILLGNLLENAAKYARSGGQMGLEISNATRSVRIWNECSTADCEALRLELPRLTEPFYRLDEARTGETGGNGLGLAICHAIATACRWQMTIEVIEQRVEIRISFASG